MNAGQDDKAQTPSIQYFYNLCDIFIYFSNFMHSLHLQVNIFNNIFPFKFTHHDLCLFVIMPFRFYAFVKCL